MFNILYPCVSLIVLTGASVGCLLDFCINLNEEEITAEAGLCVMIPCSFTHSSYFTTQNLVWFKCKPSQERCFDSEIIFHSKYSKKVLSEFKGRVSLLEPDVSWKNCSIIINDLKESDSGSYQFRVNGGFVLGAMYGFTFNQRATVSVKGMQQM